MAGDIEREAWLGLDVSKNYQVNIRPFVEHIRDSHVIQTSVKIASSKGK